MSSITATSSASSSSSATSASAGRGAPIKAFPFQPNTGGKGTTVTLLAAKPATLHPRSNAPTRSWAQIATPKTTLSHATSTGSATKPAHGLNGRATPPPSKSDPVTQTSSASSSASSTNHFNPLKRQLLCTSVGPREASVSKEAPVAPGNLKRSPPFNRSAKSSTAPAPSPSPSPEPIASPTIAPYHDKGARPFSWSPDGAILITSPSKKGNSIQLEGRNFPAHYWIGELKKARQDCIALTRYLYTHPLIQPYTEEETRERLDLIERLQNIRISISVLSVYALIAPHMKKLPDPNKPIYAYTKTLDYITRHLSLPSLETGRPPYGIHLEFLITPNILREYVLSSTLTYLKHILNGYGFSSDQADLIERSLKEYDLSSVQAYLAKRILKEKDLSLILNCLAQEYSLSSVLSYLRQPIYVVRNQPSLSPLDPTDCYETVVIKYGQKQLILSGVAKTLSVYTLYRSLSYSFPEVDALLLLAQHPLPYVPFHWPLKRWFPGDQKTLTLTYPKPTPATTPVAPSSSSQSQPQTAPPSKTGAEAPPP